MNKKLIISAALTGTGGSKQLSEHIPVTAEEIAADAVACARAGATVIHVHVHDDQGNPTMETRFFKEAVTAMRAAREAAGVDFLINLTTSGGNPLDPDELRMAHLKESKPELCSYDVGSFNWGCSGLFYNSPQLLESLAECVAQYDIKPEIEIFDAGMMGNALEYIRRGILKPPCYFQFVLGVLGAMDSSVENLEYLHRHLPPNSFWSVTGIGKGHLPMLLTGLALGCDGLRVGLEDNLYFEKGIKATNVRLVERAVQIAGLAGREIATAREAREILGITYR